MAPRGRKQKNFTSAEIEVIIEEVEKRKSILFRSVTAGVKMQNKNDAWVLITKAVNAVSPEVRTVAQVKKKWFDIKVDAALAEW